MKKLTSLSAVLLLLAIPAAVSAQTSWIGTGGNDNWFNNSNWDTLLAPNGAGFDVLIDAPSPTVLNGTATVNSLTLGTSGVLNIASSQQLVFGGTATTTLTNNGTINTATNSTLQLSGDVVSAGDINVVYTGGFHSTLHVTSAGATLSGGGTITLSSGNARLTGDAGALLTIQDQTIEGYNGGFGGLGRNALTIDNQAGGLINANVSGQALTVDAGAGGATNSGIMQASGGGILQLSNSAINNTGGTIQSLAGSTVEFRNSSITGGTVTGSNNRVFTDLEATFTGLNHTGDTFVNNNATLHLVGNIQNSGTITANYTSGFDSTIYVTSDGAILSGGGSVTLSSGNARLIGDSGALLTIQDQTIDGHNGGFGGLGRNSLTIDNQVGGLINANVSGQTLTIDTGLGGATNTGTMQASGGGILQISDSLVHNTGGTIQSLTGSTVEFTNNSNIVGGSITGQGNQVGSGNAASFTDLTHSGQTVVGNNSSLALIGTVTNTGTLRADYTSGFYARIVSNSSIGDPTILTGGGTVVLTGNNGQMSGSGYLRIEDQTISGNGNLGGGTLHVETTADSVIRGSLRILSAGGSFLNHGQIIANTSEGQIHVFQELNNHGLISIDGASGLIVEQYLFNHADGLLEGDGVAFVNATTNGSAGSYFANAGIIAPGGLGGIGNLAISPLGASSGQHSSMAGELWIDIASATEYDKFSMYGAGSQIIDFAELNVSLLDGFIPDPSDSFDVFGGINLLGEFSNASDGGTLALANGSGTFDVIYNGSQVRLYNFQSTVPEPGSGLFLLAGVLLARFRRRRTTNSRTV